MSERKKLTSNQSVVLQKLSVVPRPWDPTGRSNQLILAALGRLGMAQRRYGFPAGWEITDAGRAALAQKEGES